MNIERNSADVHIDLGQIHGTFGFSIDGKAYALEFSLAVDQVELAAENDIEPAFTVVEL